MQPASKREIPRLGASHNRLFLRRPRHRARDAQHRGVERPERDPNGGPHRDVRGVREVKDPRVVGLFASSRELEAVGARVRRDATLGDALDGRRSTRRAGRAKVLGRAGERAELARAAVLEDELEDLWSGGRAVSAARKRGEGTPGGGNGEKNGRKKKRAGRAGEPPPARGVASSVVASTHLLGQNPEIAALRLLQAPPPSLALHRGAPAVALRRRRRQSVRVRRLSRFDVCRAARRRQQLDASELGVVLLADRASCEMAMGGGGRGA